MFDEFTQIYHFLRKFFNNVDKVYNDYFKFTKIFTKLPSLRQIYLVFNKSKHLTSVNTNLGQMKQGKENVPSIRQFSLF